MIIGLTGRNAAGKTEVAHYLQKKGFAYFSLSDAIREEAEKRRMEPSRENLIMLGNDLRKKHGPSVLAVMTLKKLKGKAVVDSIRNPHEIRSLRGRGGLVLIGVTASPDLRFWRAKARGRAENADTLQEFIAMEQREDSRDNDAQQLGACLAMADRVIENTGTLKELFRKVDALLEEVREP